MNLFNYKSGKKLNKAQSFIISAQSKLVYIWIALIALIWLSVMSGIVYIVAHFISKYW